MSGKTGTPALRKSEREGHAGYSGHEPLPIDLGDELAAQVGWPPGRY